VKPYWKDKEGDIYHGNALDVLHKMPDESVNCCVTSPPYYGLRDYGQAGQIGLESTPDEYVGNLVAIFREVRQVLTADGTLWLNLGDSYAANRSYQVHNTKGASGHTYSKGSKVPDGLKQKDLIGIPWMVAFALRADGWYLRQDIIWHKPNPMPESVTDRCTKSHEYIFLLSKSERYYYDLESVKESALNHGKLISIGKKSFSRGQALGAGVSQSGNGTADTYLVPAGKIRRSVWNVSTRPFSGAHFATFPPKLIEPCILAGCPEGGTVIDPFFGSGTTGVVAYEHNRRFIGIELSQAYLDEIAIPRIERETQQMRLFS
jgi:DNA modification methylase